ncbi:hypothetical protein PVAND_016362 [Polypedilum vanderplanki]|uniref:protein-L-isoaspartate(D-aspartate) O-methyltransferase n=1 Tax=Polypedilum vanderplanki TaxID=319348 RepID=S6CDF2_POLVA|nr:hypothetical protein PVAND_016362 [Polypedilum vanderplanki]BAN67555.1 protein L-isoaspartyl methyltransferase [Polypedilum vanderplanki]
MAWQIKAESNIDLVKQLHDFGAVKSELVMKVMKETDRKFYNHIPNPYIDQSEPIGNEESIPAPHMHAYALENLYEFVKPDSKILDIGAGSGYLTACFARLIETKAAECNTIPTGMVISIEHKPELVKLAIENINDDDPNFIREGRIKIIEADAKKGCMEYAPYDVIHVGAAAPEMPTDIIRQLKVDGRMLCPVSVKGGTQQMEQYDRINFKDVIRRVLTNVVYVPIKELA